MLSDHRPPSSDMIHAWGYLLATDTDIINEEHRHTGRERERETCIHTHIRSTRENIYSPDEKRERKRRKHKQASKLIKSNKMRCK